MRLRAAGCKRPADPIGIGHGGPEGNAQAQGSGGPAAELNAELQSEAPDRREIHFQAECW